MLLVAAEADQVWPSADMARALARRLHAHGDPHGHAVLSYPQAGHSPAICSRTCRPKTRATPPRGGDQTRRNTGWLFAHHTRIALPTMLEPVIGPQYRLSHEIARLSPST